MREATQARIDGLHAQIATLVASEKHWSDTKAPIDEKALFRHLRHTRIDVAAFSPAQRELMVFAAASLPIPHALTEPPAEMR